MKYWVIALSVFMIEDCIVYRYNKETPLHLYSEFSDENCDIPASLDPLALA
jgi:hypothetical protein